MIFVIFFQVINCCLVGHRLPPLEKLISLCRKIHSWLKTNKKHVVIIHCQVNKYRKNRRLNLFAKLKWQQPELINNSKTKDKGSRAPLRVWISDEKLLVFASLISPSKSVCLRSYIKHSSQCFITISKTSKFVKNTPLRVVFSTLFSVFDMWWNTVSRVWYITSRFFTWLVTLLVENVLGLVSKTSKLLCPGSIFPKVQAGKLISFIFCSRIKS